MLSLIGCLAISLNPLPVPPRGWSTWTSFTCHINETLVTEGIHALAGNAKLKKAGFNWLLIDDCWGGCFEYDPANGKCLKPEGRDENGNLVINKKKFPNGFEPLTKLAHEQGLKIGIYTSVSAITCGGYMGSLYHEEQDARQFVNWGFDLVKHDTCGTDCPIHNGCIQNATHHMRDGIYEASNGTVVYALDHGNPVSPQRVFNPHNYDVTNKEAITKLATKPEEISWVWVHKMKSEDTDPTQHKGPHLIKHWFDRDDSFVSLMTNIHLSAKIPEYQSSGTFNNPDYITTGAGGMSWSQYRIEFYSYVILAAPLLLGNDIRTMSDQAIDLVTNQHLLDINADPDCIQGSLSRSLGDTEVWVKPLSTKDFAVLLMNKGNNPTLVNVTVNGWLENDLFPVMLDSYRVDDIPTNTTIVQNTSSKVFSLQVGAMDAALIRIVPHKVVV
eukprot:TRINITY_DN3984_c0_g1_i1.p1 TRINITY_DN3984_c0_g1~~TRINITY_DN3984_c0_g1_i1.p1  ORF type:complete len:443 (+),score=78.64 TRINITY_DN3984_c0_g1_i1:42-1370(+)